MPSIKRLRNGLLVALAVAVAGCAGATDSEPSKPRQGGLRAVLQEARENPENRAVSEVYCLLSISGGSSEFPFKAFFAGLFSVAQDDGDAAFCAALIEAAASGDLTEADLAPFDRPAEVRGKAPLGTLLRKLMVAHLRLSTQEAAVAPPTGAASAN